LYFSLSLSNAVNFYTDYVYKYIGRFIFQMSVIRFSNILAFALGVDTNFHS